MVFLDKIVEHLRSFPCKNLRLPAGLTEPRVSHLLCKVKIMKKTKFEELNISANMKKAVAEMGFCEATPIQAESIPVLMEGLDIIAQARTGSGKTAAFAIPIIERINAARGLQALVVCPTRELAIQVTEEFRKLFKFYENLAVVTAYGGQDMSIQLRQLSQSPQIVVGTPGRLIDHMWRGTIRLDEVNFVVLDEADEMLNMGFRDDVEDILSYVPQSRQTAMFSATMSPEIMRLMKRYQKNPVHIDTTDHKNEIPKIEQTYCELSEAHKFDALTCLIDEYDIKVSLVFVNTKLKVDRLVGKLNNAGYRAKGIHGGHEQYRRELAMNSFRDGSVRILVATDVAGRGIDISDIDAVINFDLPRDDEDYTHRIGRTGRAGKLGKSFTFVDGKEIFDLKRIEKNGGFSIKRIEITARGQKPVIVASSPSAASDSSSNAVSHSAPRSDESRPASRSASKRPSGGSRNSSEKSIRPPEKRRNSSSDDGWITDSTGYRYRII